jgi:hypothetical protein
MQQIEIRVKGRIAEHWSEWFSNLAIHYSEEDETILSGQVVDQAELYGLLTRLRDLGCSLVCVKCEERLIEDGKQT